ncbi:uncharacterized protein LOC108682307 [Hyalella azteca]|uniref:Uncharacterized protein LOC108682307 n=1 Tax=Hyalella azteca TaxID=294128 RepID=A0A8B7PL73_HYAAZ|nr:uncharacterized protein LOC108682307 [Hyalella azteca]
MVCDILCCLSSFYFRAMERELSDESAVCAEESFGISPPNKLDGSCNVTSSGNVQYCDTCQTSCVFMSGHRRKLQARYEGFVLVKRVPIPPHLVRSSLPYVAAAPHGHEKGHSYRRGAEEEGGGGPGEQDVAVTNGVASPQTLWTESTVPLSLRNVWTDSPVLFMPTKEKLVNIDADETAKGNILQTSTSSTYFSTSQSPFAAHLAALPTHLKQGPRREKKPRAHQRLCRKKSRSQDNLSAVRRSNSPDKEEVVLNNAIQPPPLSASHLSRSEGSIHNVHAVALTSGYCKEDDVSEALCGGGVGELARLPKKLLSRVTDEVGQWVFDLEGWNEQYLSLGDSCLTLSSTMGSGAVLQVAYSALLDVSAVQPCSAKSNKHCARLLTRDTALILQANSAYTRDQWLHSILWKVIMWCCWVIMWCCW